MVATKVFLYVLLVSLFIILTIVVVTNSISKLFGKKHSDKMLYANC